METIERAYLGLYLTVLVIVGACLIFALVRAIRGPRTADRIVGVNMAGTLTTLALALLAYILELRDVVDVCLIYCLASFLSVVVLSKVYVTSYRERSARNAGRPSDAESDAGEENADA